MIITQPEHFGFSSLPNGIEQILSPAIFVTHTQKYVKSSNKIKQVLLTS